MTTTKIVIVLAVFITKVSTQTNTTNETTYMDLIRSLQHVIDINQAWRKCPQITNLERYRGILNDAQNCLRLAEGNQTLCGVLLNNYPTCFQPLVDYFVECLPERSKDYPHLAVRQIMAIIRVLCGSTGENLIELAHPCILHYLFNRGDEDAPGCNKDELSIKFFQFKTYPPTVAEDCELVHELSRCWQAAVDHRCTSLRAREAFSNFSNAIVSSCIFTET